MDDNYEVFFHGHVPSKSSQMVIGAVLVNKGRSIDELSGAISYEGNPSRAQWEALIQAMHLAKKNSVKRLIMKGDSRNVINAMNGQPTDRNFDAMDYYTLARKTQLNFDQCFFQWIPPEKNGDAMKLAKRALEE